ncbi:MAG: 2-phospho-L-lactate guanylyltransferase [Caldilineaceae bacterium]
MARNCARRLQQQRVAAVPKPFPKLRMKLWLLAPVKPFAESKSRLANALAPAARAALSQELLARLLTCAREAGVLAGVAVVSRDPLALAQAQAVGFASVPENGQDLNLALTQASQYAVLHGADAVLVLPADLPFVSAEDIRQLYTLGQAQPGVVLTSSPDGGTNALLLRPPGLMPFAFGVNSFAQHCALAQKAGATIQVFESSTLAFDVDRPEDLASLQRLLSTGV